MASKVISWARTLNGSFKLSKRFFCAATGVRSDVDRWTAVLRELSKSFPLNPQAGGSVPAEAVPSQILGLYRQLTTRQDKTAFFLALGGNHDNHPGNSHQSSLDLVMSCLAGERGGIAQLVDLRGDLLESLKTSADSLRRARLQCLESSLQRTLSLLCAPDLLQLQRVDWGSPSDVIEKIGTEESVHPMRHWRDIKTRLGHKMRCFILTNRGIPREPLVVLYAALVGEPSSSVQDLLREANSEKEVEFRTAVFYSVWLRKRGLAGMDLPNRLIKMAVQDLQGEFPSMDVFYTLSPIPGFKKWLSQLLSERADPSEEHSVARELLKSSNNLDLLKAVLEDPAPLARPGPAPCGLEPVLMRLCAHYLVRERRAGQPLDPVASFHLKNGASLWRLNWMADRSSRGLRRSLGMMVNYQYHTAHIATNSAAFSSQRTVFSSKQLQDLLKQ